MTRRDLLPHLRAWWDRKFPGRPPKDTFGDEVLCAVEFLMYQIDPAGTRPVYLPPGSAEGYEAQPSAKPRGAE